MTIMPRFRVPGTNRRTLRACGAFGWRVGLLLVALLLSVATGESSEGDRATAGQCPLKTSTWESPRWAVCRKSKSSILVRDTFPTLTPSVGVRRSS